MKNIFLLFLSFILFSGAHAQNKAANKFSWGYKAGINYSNLRMKNTGSSPYVRFVYLDDSDWKTGLATGIFLNVKLTSKFSLQPEVLYSAMGGSNVFSNDGSRLHLNYFSIPLMLKYNLGKKVFALAGPQMYVLVNAQMKTEDGKDAVTDSYHNYSVSFTGGIEYRIIKSLSVTSRYIYSPMDVSKSEFVEMKNQGVQITAGISL